MIKVLFFTVKRLPNFKITKMYCIKILVLTVILVLVGYSLNAQNEPIEAVTVSATFIENGYEVTLQNTGPIDLELSFIIIQDNVLHFISGNVLIVAGETKQIFFVVDPTVPPAATLQLHESCLSGGTSKEYCL